MVELKQNNIFFDPINLLYKVINDNVNDPNKLRADSENYKEKQCIFPTTPESNDENYPRIALISEDVRFETYGGSNYIEDIENGLTGSDRRVLRTHYGKVAIIPFTIGVFVKKKEKYSVEYYDGTVHNIQNTKLSDYIGNQIAKVLQLNRRTFIDNNMDIRILSISSSYDNNSFTWAKNIRIEIELFDVWTKNYSDADIIKIIDIQEIQVDT